MQWQYYEPLTDKPFRRPSAAHTKLYLAQADCLEVIQAANVFKADPVKKANLVIIDPGKIVDSASDREGKKSADEPWLRTEVLGCLSQVKFGDFSATYISCTLVVYNPALIHRTRCSCRVCGHMCPSSFTSTPSSVLSSDLGLKFWVVFRR
jgi:hypothetical protein